MGKAVFLMKSILIGDPAMCKHAFPASVRAQLGAWTQLPDAPVTKEEILAQPNLYRDTELIFSTWDMPHFTREELQECIRLVENGTLTPYVSDFYRLEQINDALAALRACSGLGRSAIVFDD